MLAAFAADWPSSDDEGLARMHGPVKNRRHLAQQRKTGCILRREIAGTIQRGPQELGSDQPVIARHAVVGRPGGRDAVSAIVKRSRKDAHPVAALAVGSA